MSELPASGSPASRFRQSPQSLRTADAAAALNRLGAFADPIGQTTTEINSDDLEQAAEQMQPMVSVEFTHIDAGPAGMRGFIVQSGSVRVGHWGGSCAKTVRMALPSGALTLSLPTRGSGRYGTTSVEQGACVLMGPGTSVTAFTGRHFESTVIGIRQDKWSEYLQACGLDQNSMRPEVRVLTVPTAKREIAPALAKSAARLTSLVEAGKLSASGSAAFEDSVLDAAAGVLGLWDEPPVAPQSKGAARHRAAVRARDFIDANLDRPLTLAGVCKAACSSARALEYAFQEMFGSTPMAYARCARLSNARRELHKTRDAGHSVTDVAMRWGFWHLGQFSRDYRALFGELPSATLARSRSHIRP